MGIAAKRRAKQRLVREALRRAGITVTAEDDCVQVCGPLGCVEFCFGEEENND
ncbi:MULTISPECIES: hypothetical protein [Sutcliffiella]|uniref:hypothetical protein n=1 Tax=Sutcliffiella TaxID=2837511 RepID=UPI000A513CE8|nr:MULTISPECIES: hypothetical protein [Sutcliffiella]WBL14876.1 hypothetical protein O1A01_23910 [Sutcliffiella sp. NC1]